MFTRDITWTESMFIYDRMIINVQHVVIDAVVQSCMSPTVTIATGAGRAVPSLPWCSVWHHAVWPWTKIDNIHYYLVRFVRVISITIIHCNHLYSCNFLLNPHAQPDPQIHTDAHRSAGETDHNWRMRSTTGSGLKNTMCTPTKLISNVNIKTRTLGMTIVL